MKRVIGFAAVALMFASIGCATGSHKSFNHSESEVVTAMLEAEEAALARMRASPSTDVAEAARHMAEQDRVH
jgi:hypothetical protein